MTRSGEGRKRVRCAIYTRRSSAEGLEQEFSSLDAQREACLAYVLSQKHEGWTALPQRYDDGGFSGGSMERPALRRLLDDVRAGKVETVLTYKVDRLTRALADFARIVAIFESAQVAYVSVTQSFDTRTPMGRLTLHVLLSFAQFERELAAERIRDKIAASRARGLWTGGIVPIGYRAEARSLIPVPEEADLVRRIFARYLALGSVRRLKAELDAAGLRTPERNGGCHGGAGFSRGRIYELLANPLFIGRIRHRNRVYPGQHAAIVDPGLWQAVQDRLAANRVSRSLRRTARAASPLAGRLFDPEGRGMRPSHARRKGKRFRYYISGDLVEGSVATGAIGWRIPAGEIETAVARALAARLRDPEFLADALRTQQAPAAAARLLEGIAALAGRLEDLGSPSGREALRLLVTRVELSQVGLRAEVRFPAREAAAADGSVDPALAALPDFSVAAPLRLQRRGGELRLLLQGAAAAPPRPDPLLMRTLVAARRRVADYLDPDQAISVSAVARREGSDVGDVSRSLQLGFLAPDLVERILDGTQPPALTAEGLKRLRRLPLIWDEQRALLG